MKNTIDKQFVIPLAPSIRQRNEMFDSLFYDVKTLTDEEKYQLSSLTDREGSILVVFPQKKKKGIVHSPDASTFLQSEVFKTIQIIVVAGVGSSALGTAALARNVANVYDIPVAGIVSGYGASDLITEAMGGWFFYGATDAIRHSIRETVNSWNNALTFFKTEKKADEAGLSKEMKQSELEDINALEEILNASPPKLRLLVGHSKGSLMLDYALENFANKHDNHVYFDQLKIVTFSAVTDISPQFKNVQQFIGEYDGFGKINSRIHIPRTPVPHASHHLNSTLPFYLDIEDVLRQHVTL
ncbi:MAG: hypothetical protein WC799_14845 [Desulfobacteraceae bacterium]